MIRNKLVITATATLAAALGALTIGFSSVLSWRLEQDADGVLRARAEAAAANITIRQGHLALADTPYDEALDSSVWVFDGNGTLISSPSRLSRLDPAARTVSTSPQPTPRDVHDDTRMLALRLRDAGAPKATVVAALSLIPYEDAARTALIGALIFDVLILAIGAFFIRRTVLHALRPVGQMTAQAATWSERDLDRRFGLGPPRDELTGLAATLDTLLARLSAALRHEKRVTAEIAHELRTPLTQLRLETEIALRQDRPPDQLRSALRQVLAGTDRLADTVDTLIGLAQQSIDPSTGTCKALEAANAALRSSTSLDKDVRLDPSAQTDLVVACDRDVVLRILHPLLDNAARYGRSTVMLGICRDGNNVVFSVADDGPGFGPEEISTVFMPGVQGAAAGPGEGAGLGLALARRLTDAAGGTLTAKLSNGGLIEVHLPAA
ncbi:HAMP domain-containing sensor histidine kinase [Planotetraspora phitsanulokensis]|uniref:histidine kinase n=1 Tax=Planotetraspora phitsanulokensis TaxID=575192 RepID=A0A8J3U1C7_9ACTN|nr:ATP-binding protein [Planotetraspora phitsanulokensis]GII36092.1 two-component sensor histidine kinase [Planotetraspora phitsanulokensis]